MPKKGGPKNGKKSSGGRGKGKGKGKGGGKGNAAKRKARRAEREEEMRAKRIKKEEAAEVEAEKELEEVVAKPRAAKPGFNALLNMFGVAEEAVDDESDSDEEEEEDDEDEEDTAPAKGKKPNKNSKKQKGQAAADDDDDDNADDDEDAAISDAENGNLVTPMKTSSLDPEDQKKSENVDASADGTGDGDGDLDAPDDDEEDEEDEEEEEDDEAGDEEAAASDDNSGRAPIDLFPHFWNDPPGPLDPKSKSKEEPSAPQFFNLPDLRRCEARRRDTTVFQNMVRESVEKQEKVWEGIALANGLRDRFEAMLKIDGIDLSKQELALLAFASSYLDVSFPMQTHLNAKASRAVLALHVMNHFLKTRKRLSDIQRLRAKQKLRSSGNPDGPQEVPIVQEQGFTRPQILILCPFRSAAFELMDMLVKLYPSNKEIPNIDRFHNEFGAEDDQVDSKRPPDWQHLFNGNNDDNFRLGIRYERKRLKLYANFGKSDIILCSPLGLRQIIGAPGDSRRNFDFLSSIELCVVDRADVLAMQNWEHVVEIMKVLNHKPLHLGDIDISKLRPAFAEGKARLFRQTLVTSNGQTLEGESLFHMGPSDAEGLTTSGAKDLLAKWGTTKGKAENGRKTKKRGRFSWDDEDDEEAPNESFLKNSLATNSSSSSSAGAAVEACRGFVRLSEPPNGEPLEQSISLGVAKQFFLHVPCPSAKNWNDAMFQAFTNRYWKPLGSTLDHLLIVANSYFSFLKLRRYLREQGASFASVFEYSDGRQLGLSRLKFFHGERKVLLTTERFLWYRRFHLKGADYVLFYGPPQTAAIYEDLLNGVRTPSHCNSMTLFTPHDAFALERIVGQERAKKMLTSQAGKVFVYS